MKDTPWNGAAVSNSRPHAVSSRRKASNSDPIRRDASTWSPCPAAEVDGSTPAVDVAADKGSRAPMMSGGFDTASPCRLPILLACRVRMSPSAERTLLPGSASPLRQISSSNPPRWVRQPARC